MLEQQQQQTIKTRQFFVEVEGGGVYFVGPDPKILDRDECVALAKELPCEILDGDIYLTIKKEDARYSKTYRRVQTCVHDASKNFLEAILGKKMDSTDRDWYTNLAIVDESGAPHEKTLTVVQALLEPYGVGVSEVILPVGAVCNEEQRMFMAALGCNPMAVSDRKTTNEEFFDMVGGKNNGQYRFRFAESIHGPAVIAEQYSTAMAHATGGGHASYLPPRRRSSDFKLAFRLDLLERIGYQSSPPVLDQSEMAPQETLSIYDCMVGNESIRQLLRRLIPATTHYISPYSGSSRPSDNRQPEMFRPRGFFWDDADTEAPKPGSKKEQLVDAFAEATETDDKFWGWGVKHLPLLFEDREKPAFLFLDDAVEEFFNLAGSHKAAMEAAEDFAGYILFGENGEFKAAPGSIQAFWKWANKEFSAEKVTQATIKLIAYIGCKF
jgi:hypothetical protein